MKRKLIVGAASTLLVGGGLYFGGGSLLGSLSASHTPEPPSVSELYSLANRLPSSKASVVRNEAAQQAAEIAGHPPAPMGSAAYEEGLAQAEALTAAAPPPSYSYGISPGQQPSELGFASKAEWITKYQGNVYGVFGGAKVDPNNGNPTMAGVLVMEFSSSGVKTVGEYPYQYGGAGFLVPKSYSGEVLMLSYPQGTIGFNLATRTFVAPGS